MRFHHRKSIPSVKVRRECRTKIEPSSLNGVKPIRSQLESASKDIDDATENLASARDDLVSDKSSRVDRRFAGERVVATNKNAMISKSQKFICAICSFTTHEHLSFAMHFKISHRKAYFIPNAERDLFRNIEELRKRNAHFNVLFECYICKEKLANETSGLIHFHEQHGFDKIIFKSIVWSDSTIKEINDCICACQKKFRAPQTYLAHLYIHHAADYANMREVKLGILKKVDNCPDIHLYTYI